MAGPDGRTSVSRSNGIAGLTIRDDKVYLALTGDPRFAAAMETMRVEVEKAIKAVPGVANAVISLTTEMPAVKPAAPKPAPAAPRAAPARNIAIPGINRIIAVASGKGGVGKSTTTVNLALGMAALGWKIGILDADIYGPSLPRLLGLKSQHPEREGSMLKPVEAFGLKAMSIGFLVGEEEAMIWRGPMVMSAINQLLREVDWGELDCLVVDMPPGTGDAQLTLAQAVPLAGAVIVSTPQDLALIDARRGRRDVPEDQRADPRRDREHELFHLPALPGAIGHLRLWRGAARSRTSRRAIPRRSAVGLVDPRAGRFRHADGGGRARQCGRPRLSRDRRAREGGTRRRTPANGAEDYDGVSPSLSATG